MNELLPHRDVTPQPQTHFAPATRAASELLAAQAAEVAASPVFQTLLQSLDSFMVILNHERQVLAANPAVLEKLGITDPACAVGARPGEAFGCPHAAQGPGGCGTSAHCATCGAVGAILAAQQGEQPVVRECLMTLGTGAAAESMEFRVRASQVQVGEHAFTVVTFTDISAEKRREALEQVFFHDILNTIGGLKGWSRLLGVLKGEQAANAAQRIVELSDRLTREVRDQRLLLEAERGTLAVERRPVGVGSILETLEMVFASHDAAAGKSLVVCRPDPEVPLLTDESLVVRILTNMTKNALEAVRPGGEVRLWCEAGEAGDVTFRVRNAGVMPPAVATQVFVRSFSTKASAGRGLGTYSMKLFGERYLGGRVWFETNEANGTTFSFALPVTAR